MKVRSLAFVLFVLVLQITPGKASAWPSQDTDQVLILNKKAFKMKNSDPERSRLIVGEAIILAKQRKDTLGLSTSYNILGYYYKVKDQYKLALALYKESLKIRERLKDTVYIARSCRNLLDIHESLGYNQQAILYGLRGLKLLENKREDSTVVSEKAGLNSSLCWLYTKTGNYEQAMSRGFTANNLYSQLQDSVGLANVTMNLGNLYEEQHLYPKAIQSFQEVIQIQRKMERWGELAKAYNHLGNVYYDTKKYAVALMNYQKALSIRLENEFDEDLKGSYLNIGLVHKALKKNDSAFYYYQKAWALSLQSEDMEGQYEIRRSLGALFYQQQKYKEALSHLLASERLSKEEGGLTERIALLDDLSKVYAALGKPDSALFYSNKQLALNDSLYEQLLKSTQLGSDLEAKNERLTYITERRNMMITGMTIAIILLLIIFFLYYRYARTRRNAQALKAQVKDKELQALDAMLEGQQEERKRLAVELHDTIGSMLSATKYSFKAMEKSVEKMLQENKEQYQRIDTMLDNTMDSVRRISHDMASGLSMEKDLEHTLADFCHTLEQTGRIQIHLQVYGLETRLEPLIEFHLFRISQELLNNILKHANATDVNIQIMKTPGNLNLMVEDNGRGFDPEEGRKNKGIGLSNIDLRVEKLAGKWHIDSGKGNGTTIIIDIPINDVT